MGLNIDKPLVECGEQRAVIDKSKDLEDKIPICSDGTKYGSCSETLPLYCYAGELVERCRVCGCPEGQECDRNYIDEDKKNKWKWGKCVPDDSIACFQEEDCGNPEYVGNYYCKDGNVYMDYKEYLCLTPGELDSKCSEQMTPELIDSCLENEACVEGEVECQDVSILKCSDGTPYRDCAYDKPKYCDDGVLVDNCDKCGCKGIYQECKPDQTCQDIPRQKLTCKSQNEYKKNCGDCEWNCNSKSDCDVDCDPGDIYVKVSKRSTCNFIMEKCEIHCLDVYQTSCGVNPICQTGYVKTSSTSCIGTCTENWACDGWSVSVNGVQTRTCIDLNDCLTTKTKPDEKRTWPGGICVEDWQCTAWSACPQYGGENIRTCTELNNCGTELNKPIESKVCFQPPPDVYGY
ncbi:MAG: hypothetical protein L6408_06690 [Nanoarchaeota archaeon]|nr:hypothetical protein [Nanoarchaeota archaeon]